MWDLKGGRAHAERALDRDDLLTVQEFKTAERTKVEAEGYTIIADVGDQISDLEGEHSGCHFKVPNPFYFIR
jgi:acid phosphatase